MTGYRRALLASLACVLAAVAWAQEAPAPADDEGAAREADASKEETAPPPASKEEAAEQLRKEAEATAESEGSAEGGAAPAEGKESAGADQQSPGNDEDGDFIPTEKIWADSAIAFPSDI